MYSITFPVKIIPKNSYFVHCETYNYFPQMSNYPINNFAFFTVYERAPPENESYWSSSGMNSDSVTYTYQSKRDLKLLCVKTAEFHNHICNLIKLPYNKYDPTFPYESDKTYVWDYIDMDILMQITDYDGVFRNNEVVLFKQYEEKIDFVKLRANGNPDKINSYLEIYPGYSIYYVAPEEIINELSAIIRIN